MTDREKAIVMAYTGYATLTGEKWSIFHAYVEELVGRPVWSHEFASPVFMKMLQELASDDFVRICEAEDENGRKTGAD